MLEAMEFHCTRWELNQHQAGNVSISTLEIQYFELGDMDLNNITFEK